MQCDEIWAFVYAKAKNLPEQYKGAAGYGDVWTWTALDADSKLIVSWAVGRRDGFHSAERFRRSRFRSGSQTETRPASSAPPLKPRPYIRVGPAGAAHGGAV